jgi:hypothetical protein
MSEFTICEGCAATQAGTGRYIPPPEARPDPYLYFDQEDDDDEPA